MSDSVNASDSFRLAVDTTVLTTGLAMVGYVVSSVALPDLPLVVALGAVYGVVLAGFIDRSVRHGGLSTPMMGLFALALFVPMFAVLVVLQSAYAVETLLLFYGIGVMPAAALELYRTSGR